MNSKSYSVFRNRFKRTGKQRIKNHFKLSVIFFLLQFTSIFPQQKIIFDRLSINDGLSQSSVQAIVQDDKGFMWFGTEDGLNKYDGYEFTVYKNDPADSTSISENNVMSLLVDSEGILWAGTVNGGLNRFDPVKEEFECFKCNPDDSLSLSNDIIICLIEDSDKNIWIGTYGGGVNKFNKQTKEFTQYRFNPDDPNSISNNIILSLYEDSNLDMWIGTMGGGLNKYNKTEDNFTSIKHIPGNNNSLNSNRIWSILEDNDFLWLGTMGGGINKLNLKTGEVNHFVNNPEDENSLSHNQVTSLLKDDKGNLWIATYDGLNIYDKDNNNFIRYKNDPDNINSVSGNAIRYLFRDRSRIIWVGTHGNGLNKFVGSRIKFNSLENIVPAISGKTVFSIFKSSKNKNVIWVGTFGSGLIKHNFENNVSKIYRNNPADPGSISENFIQDIAEDEFGNIWIAPLGGSLDKYDKENDNFIHYSIDRKNPDNPKSLSDNRVHCLYADKKGTLWIGTLGGGLNRFDIKNETFIHYKNNTEDENSLSSNMIKVIHEDKNGDIWIGTSNGLNKFEIEKEKFTRYLFNRNNKNSLSNNEIQSIYEQPGDELVLWIGTYGGGLNKFEVDSGTFTHFKEEDGLPNNSIYEIVADDNGFLWITTNRGLTRFIPFTGKFRNYDVYDGLLSNEFNGGASFKDLNGNIYFGNVKGVNYFHPENVKDNSFIPPVVITRLQKFNKEVKLDTSITELKQLVLSYNDYVFSLEFSALDYSFPDKNKYSYTLEGFETEWNNVNGRRHITYTNLDPGEYVFRVKGSNSDEVWNEKGASLSLIVTPPFWQTWWFRTLIFAFAGLSVLFVINRVKVKEKRKTEINKKIYDLKIAALASQMKPHFVFNTINSIQYLISDNKQKEALIYLSKFSELLRMTLENSLKSTVSLSREIQFLKLYLELEKLRFEEKFDYKIEIDESINTSSFEIPVMCIQPYVENAVVHGFKTKKEKGNLTVQFEQINSSLKCNIIDNGIGFKKSVESKKEKEHKSLGMKITKERLELLTLNNQNADVNIIDIGETENDKTGTKVEIVLPVEVNY